MRVQDGDFDPQNGTFTTFTASTILGITIITCENASLSISDDFTVEIIYSTILKQGWNLISIPLIQEDETLSEVLNSIDGKYNAIRWYDITDKVDSWKHNKIGKPYGNDLFELNESMGYWIHITPPGGTIFRYNGTQPTENQSIALHPGWNLVGYPSLANYNRTTALSIITFGIDVNAIWTYNASSKIWEEMGESDYFQAGRGYWINSKVEKTWEVPL